MPAKQEASRFWKSAALGDVHAVALGEPIFGTVLLNKGLWHK